MVTCKQGSKTIESAVVAGEDIRGQFGGGDEATITIPLWKYLTRWEKKQVRFAIKMYQRGELAELRARYGETDLNRIINQIHKNALDIPREKRTTRKGMIYGTFGNERTSMPGYAGIESNERRT